MVQYGDMKIISEATMLERSRTYREILARSAPAELFGVRAACVTVSGS